MNLALRWLIAGLLVFVAGCASSGTEDRSPEREAPETVERPPAVELVDSEIIPIADSPFRGAEDSWVHVVVFSDFQCPFCARLSATLERVVATFDEGTVRVVYKHFPLSRHRGARPAAQAAEAAGEQGKFWEMHDALFDDFPALDDDDLEARLFELAESLGLEMEQFRADFSSQRIAERIDRDVELAEQLDLRGAPAVFVNGGFIAGVQSPQIYQGAIADLVRILKQSVEDGEMRREDTYRRSVETLFAHTRPEATRGPPDAESVVSVPLDGARPTTGPADEALVHLAFFVSLGAEPSLETQRLLSEIIAHTEGDVRVTYFHLPHNLEEPSMLAHRALHGATTQQVGELLGWLADRDNDWRQELDLLRDYIEEEGIEVADEESFRQVIEADMEAAGVFEVYGTPTLFINGIRFVGVPDPDKLNELIEEQIALAIRVGEVMNLSGRALYDAMVDGNREREQRPVESENFQN